MFNRQNGRAALILLTVFASLVITGGAVLAAFQSTGPGCALGPDEAIASAAPGDIITPLYEEEFGRNTNGAVISVSLEIEGGWSSPSFDCGGNSSGFFASREEMLAAGLVYTPTNRSSLTGFDDPTLGLAEEVDSLIIRNVNLLVNQQVSGGGGGLRVAGAGAEPRLSGASVLIENSAFQPNFFNTDPVGAQGDGGGLNLDLDAGSRLLIRDSLFKDQTAGGRGGGFALTVRGGSQVTIERTLVEGNRAASCGGGLITIHSGVVTLRDVAFQSNGADGEVADLCVERAGDGSGAAVLYLIGTTFSESGLRVGPDITVFTTQVFLPAVIK